jgi:hypothetical protein
MNDTNAYLSLPAIWPSDVSFHLISPSCLAPGFHQGDPT